MEGWQSILVYITLALALGYLVRRYLFPSTGKSGKNDSSGDCGTPDCGCH